MTRLTSSVSKALQTLGRHVEAVETIRPEATEKGLGVDVEVPAGIGLDLDRRLLLQCLLNFLSNAVKYSEEGSISITAREIGEQVEISVSDTGIGIAEADMPRLVKALERIADQLEEYNKGKFTCQLDHLAEWHNGGIYCPACEEKLVGPDGD